MEGDVPGYSRRVTSQMTSTTKMTMTKTLSKLIDMPPTHGTTFTYNEGCRCDECRKARSDWAKGRYQKRGEYIRAYNRAQHQKHRLKRLEAKFKSAYGITYAERDAMIASQNGVCAICQGNEPLEADHCHDLGHVRGMLCGSCNRALGMMLNDPERLRKAADYLEQTTR